MAAEIKQEGGDSSLADINVTPMVDVLLCLLIVFMVATPPSPNQQIPLDVPQEVKTQAPDDPEATLLITIDADGKATLGEAPLSADYDEMVNQLRDNKKLQNDGRVAIDANPKVKYGAVIRVMSAAHEAGIAKVGVASDRL